LHVNQGVARRAVTVALLLSAFAMNACVAPRPNLAITADQWRADLRQLADELPKRHMNAFHAVSRPAFEAAVADLDRRIPSLDGDQVFVGLATIVRMIGDGHTSVRIPDDSGALPLRIRRFGDEWRVAQVAAGGEAALGAKVLAIGGAPIAEAHARMLAVTPSDESQELRDALADMLLTRGLFLHGFGLAPDRNHARLDLEGDDGRRFGFDAAAMPAGAKPVWRGPAATPTLAEQRPDDPLWCAPLQGGRTIYCDFRSYKGLSSPAAALRAQLAAAAPDKLIIDLRQNGGGDFFVGLRELVDPIAKLPAINRKGRLFVLIGVMTFSAAMSNAAHFRQRTAALLVGEAIGERPNSYQENGELTLTNSHLVVSYSTRFYSFAPAGGENRIRPDIPVETTWADVKAGRDPALQRALEYPGG
jgi:hypothetical protein